MIYVLQLNRHDIFTLIFGIYDKKRFVLQCDEKEIRQVFLFIAPPSLYSHTFLLALERVSL